MQLLVGSYSGGAPDGIRLVAFDEATGDLSLSATLEGAPDASYLAYDRNHRRLYAVDEMGQRVGGFTVSSDGRVLQPLGYQPAGSNYTCYVALNPDRTHVAAANYGSDLAVVFALDADGALRDGAQQLHGTKPAAEGHAHCVQWSPEGDRIYVVDLGHDEIRFYPFDAPTGRAGAPTTAFAMPAGSGPRHLVFHPGGKFAYCMTEYANTLTAFAREADGTLREIETLSTLPADFTGESSGAHIQLSPAGDVAYVSNRGHNSIAAFRIATDGGITHLQTIGCGGNWPRFFLRLDRHLIVANQESGDLQVFDVAADGTLTATGKSLALPKPVMVLPL